MDIDNIEEIQAGDGGGACERPVTISTQLEDLEKEVHGHGSMNHRLTERETMVSDLMNNICSLKAENKASKEEMALLKVCVIKKDKEISRPNLQNKQLKV